MSQILFDERADFSVEKGILKQPMPMMHYHNTFELYYLVNGEREYFLENKFYKVLQGDIVLIPSNVLHRTAGKGASRILVYFSRETLCKYFSESLLSALPLDSSLVFRPDENVRRQIERELDTLSCELQSKDTRRDAEALSAVSLVKILALIRQSENRYSFDTYADGRIGDIVRYINDNYTEIDDIEQIAEKFFISKYHLCRIFNKNLGISLISYLNTIKIRSAIELMRNGQLNLTQIATRSGFNSSSYFCKVFKSEKGVTPATFRRQMNSK